MEADESAVVTACHALGAVPQKRPADTDAPMDTAAELAGRFGLDSLSPIAESHGAGVNRFMFNPVDAVTAQMWLALETREPDQAVTIADGVNPGGAGTAHSGTNLSDHGTPRPDGAEHARRTDEPLNPGRVGEELREMARQARLPV